MEGISSNSHVGSHIVELVVVILLMMLIQSGKSFCRASQRTFTASILIPGSGLSAGSRVADKLEWYFQDNISA